MPITEVRTHRISAPLHTSYVTAARRTATLDTLIVEVRDTDGHVGFGEAPQVWQVNGASVAGSEACVQGILAPLLIGADPDELTGNCRAVRHAVVGNEAAKSALDVALHDLAARRLGVPLVRLLGGTAVRIPTLVTLSAVEEAAVAEAAAARVKEGFTVLKMKVGLDAAEDFARVRAVRAAVGPHVRLRLDANEGWSARDAVRVIRTVEDAGLDVELVEQPVHRADLAGLAWVTERVDTPVMADESVFTLADLIEVTRRRAVDMISVKLAKCGGLIPARALLALAEEQQIGALVGVMMESHVGVGAAASLVSASGSGAVSHLDAAWWLAWSPVRGGPRYAGGTLLLSDAPGLGINGLVIG